MPGIDGSHEIIRGIIYAVNEIGIALRVGSPLDNDLIKPIVALEITIVESALNIPWLRLTHRMS